MDFMNHIVSDANVNITIVFGLCLVFGVLGGIIANRISWMPTITAFMLLGLVIGPSGFEMISAKTLKNAGVFIDIALGLILYDLGTMLHPRAMLKSKRLLTVSICECLATYIVVFLGANVLGLGILSSAVIAAIAVSSSPAVLVHVSAEMQASGPVSDLAKSLVAINNLVAFLLFSMALPFVIIGADKSFFAVFFLPLYKLAGALALGIGIAWVATRIAQMLRQEDHHYRFAIVIGAVMLTIGFSEMLGMSALFAPLVMGLATRFFESRHHKLSTVGLGEGGDLFFIVLFVMAGAKINVADLAHVGWIPVALALLRTAGKTAGVYVAGYIREKEEKTARAISMMLTPMAGMAIGLVSTTSVFSPELGSRIATLIFAMIVIFETVGPLLVTYALRLVGEVGKKTDTDVEPVF